MLIVFPQPALSRALGCWAIGVSKFRGNVRLSVQRKAAVLDVKKLECQDSMPDRSSACS